MRVFKAGTSVVRRASSTHSRRVELLAERGRGASGVTGSAGSDNKLHIKEDERSFSRGASEVAVAMKDVKSSQEVAAPLWTSSTVEIV